MLLQIFLPAIFYKLHRPFLSNLRGICDRGTGRLLRDRKQRITEQRSPGGGGVGVRRLRGRAEVLDMLEELAAAGGLPEGLFTPLVKTLGIALVSRLGGEICRDAGQGAMAAVLDTAGAFGAVLVSLPLVRAAWELLRTLV